MGPALEPAPAEFLVSGVFTTPRGSTRDIATLTTNQIFDDIKEFFIFYFRYDADIMEMLKKSLYFSAMCYKILGGFGFTSKLASLGRRSTEQHGPRWSWLKLGGVHGAEGGYHSVASGFGCLNVFVMKREK